MGASGKPSKMQKAVKTTKAKAEKKNKVANALPKFKILASPESVNGKLNWGIGETTDYSIFTHVNEYKDGLNRKVNPTHSNNVLSSILKHGDSVSVKAVVFDALLIPIDGNTRLRGMDDGSGTPLRFTFRYVSTIDELVDIMIDHNCVAKNWVLGQYVNTHATKGLKPYMVLQDIVNLGKVKNITIAAAIVSNSTVNTAKKYIRNGQLSMDSRANAIYRANDLKRFFNAYIDGKNLAEAPLDYQRMGEGLISFIGVIGWEKFSKIKIDLANGLRNLTLKGGLIGQKTSGSFEHALKTVLDKI